MADVRYDGSACLNVRSITSACALMSAKSDAPLRWADLSTVLWFVETSVTSKALFFDGTVPKETAGKAVEQIERFKSENDLGRLKIGAIAFDDPADTLKAAGDALAESRLLIDNFALDAADAPVDDAEHRQFFEQLQIIRAQPEATRRDLAVSWVADAFRGSKCLAAMVVNGDAALRAAQAIYDRHSGQGALVTGALINRFRLNYVNQLAAHKKSAYVPNPEFETLTQAHFRLFKDYLLEKLVAQAGKEAAKEETPNVLVENMKAEAPLPPIGLYALLVTRTRAPRPAAILETAYDEFRRDAGLMKLIWRNTRGGIALRSSPDSVREVDEYFLDRWVELEKEAKGLTALSSRRKGRTYLIPAILKGLVKAIPEAVPGLREGWKVVYSVLKEIGTEVTVPFIGDRLLDLGCDSYIAGYQNLKYDFAEDERVKTTLGHVAEQVERVFGRKLLLPA
jgi:hypothetical protein